MQGSWLLKVLRSLAVLGFASGVLTTQASAAGCHAAALPAIGGVLAIVPAGCEPPPEIAPARPDTEFRIQSGGWRGEETGQVMATAARVDAERCGVRQVPIPVHVNVDSRSGSPDTGMSSVAWRTGFDGRPAIVDITITLFARRIQSFDQLQFVAGHEYMHALHQSLGLVQLPADVEEGLAYWMEYSNSYPTDGETGAQLSAWDQEALPNWARVRYLALNQLRGSGDPDHTQLGALATAYIFHDLGCHGWLEALLAGDGSRASIDAQLRQRTGHTWIETQGLARDGLQAADGGRAAFTELARER